MKLRDVTSHQNVKILDLITNHSLDGTLIWYAPPPPTQVFKFEIKKKTARSLLWKKTEDKGTIQSTVHVILSFEHNIFYHFPNKRAPFCMTILDIFSLFSVNILKSITMHDIHLLLLIMSIPLKQTLSIVLTQICQVDSIFIYSHLLTLTRQTQYFIVFINKYISGYLYSFCRLQHYIHPKQIKKKL